MVLFFFKKFYRAIFILCFSSAIAGQSGISKKKFRKRDAVFQKIFFSIYGKVKEKLKRETPSPCLSHLIIFLSNITLSLFYFYPFRIELFPVKGIFHFLSQENSRRASLKTRISEGKIFLQIFDRMNFFLFSVTSLKKLLEKTVL